jgi:hypothetical protein
MITVEIIERSAPALKRIQADASDVLPHEIGRAVVELLQRHFRALPANKRGFPTSNFWGRAADATQYDATPDGVRVNINQTGVRQRFLGGPIAPVRGKYLTIPNIAETYGHSAREFGDLKMCTTEYHGLPSPGLAPADVVESNRGRVNPDSVWFFLRRAVWQRPDPEVLPTNEEIAKAAIEAARNAFSK